jgi:hypothetical protein
MQPEHTLITVISASTTLAALMDHRLEDIQCRCLSVSTDAKPTVCTYMEFQKLDWYTASSFASDHNLKLHFASQDTITKVLSINRPLPTSVLETIGEADVAEVNESGWMQSGNKIVCGFGDEVEHLGMDNKSLEPEDVHFVSYVVAGMMVLIGFYVFAAYVWARYVILLDKVWGHFELTAYIDTSQKVASS